MQTELVRVPGVAAALVFALVPMLAVGATVAIVDEARPAGGIPPRRIQAATLNDGFVVLERAPLQRVVPVSREGVVGDSLHLPRLPTDARALGLRTGDVSLLYQHGKRVRFAVVEPDGELRTVTQFGTRVHGFCDQVASNEHRFGVAWTEQDGSVWFAHGPLDRATIASDSAAVEVAALAAQPSYCAIASAGDQIALLWQEQATVTLNICDRTRCKRATHWKLTGNRQVRAFGCTRSACGIVTRTTDGTHELTWIGSNGKPRWTQRLPEVASTSELSVVGAGLQHVVVGHSLHGADVGITAADETGKLRLVWTGTADAAPWLTWSRDRLLFARQQGGALALGFLKREAIAAAGPESSGSLVEP